MLRSDTWSLKVSTGRKRVLCPRPAQLTVSGSEKQWAQRLNIWMEGGTSGQKRPAVGTVPKCPHLHQTGRRRAVQHLPRSPLGSGKGSHPLLSEWEEIRQAGPSARLPSGGLRCALSPCPASAHPQEFASSPSEKERGWHAVRSTRFSPQPGPRQTAARSGGSEQAPRAIPRRTPGPQERALAAAPESCLQTHPDTERCGCITPTSP